MIREAPWFLVAQLFIGAFFFAVGAFKFVEYFVDETSIALHFFYMTNSKLCLPGYCQLLEIAPQLQGNLRIMEIFTVVLQGGGGLMLLLRRTRIGGLMILLVQANIFLGFFYHIALRDFMLTAMWAGCFFALQPVIGTKRRTMTLALTMTLLLFWYYRARFGDMWPVTIPAHIDAFHADVVSINHTWKAVAAWIFDHTGWWLLPFSWWVQLMLTLMLPTRHGTKAGAALLFFSLVRFLTFPNVMLSHGALQSLVLFVWVTHEEWRRRQDTHNGK